MWTLIFPADLYKRLEKLLFSTAPLENGCFLLAGHHRTRNASLLMVTGVMEPGPDSWNRSGRHALEPDSSFINRCAVEADATDSSLLFVHTHPDPDHPSGFSSIDERSNRRLFSNLSQILPARPLGSLVFGGGGGGGICGVVHDTDGKLCGVGRIKIVGNTMTVFPGVGFDSGYNGSQARFDRQIRVLGRRGQEGLQQMTASVIGAGGTGSPVAVQLARMGIGRLRLVDSDMIDETNLPRVYGSTDADVGRPKADVLRDHITSFSECGVDAICADVSDAGLWDELVESDVIFACTDNLTSRCVLNEIAYRYFIPLIDVGCRIRLDGDGGAVSQAVAKVQVVTPDGACLWCSGTLDGRTILQESFTPGEKRRLAGEGYCEAVERQPNVISLTTMAASMAVNKLLGLLGVFGTEYGTRTQIELRDGFMIDDSPESKPGCVCRKGGGTQFPREMIST